MARGALQVMVIEVWVICVLVDVDVVDVMAGVAAQAALPGLAAVAAKVGATARPQAGGQGVRGGVQGVRAPGKT